MDIFGITKSKVRSELLYRLFNTPDGAFYVRELERVTGASAGNVRRELLRLTEAGLLKRRGDGNTVRYELNADYPLIEETRAIVEKLLEPEYALRHALEAVDEVALAYAVRKPARRGGEQIDVTVVGEPDNRQLMEALRPVEQRLRIRLICSVYAPADYDRQVQTPGTAPGNRYGESRIHLKDRSPTSGR